MTLRRFSVVLLAALALSGCSRHPRKVEPWVWPGANRFNTLFLAQAWTRSSALRPMIRAACSCWDRTSRYGSESRCRAVPGRDARGRDAGREHRAAGYHRPATPSLDRGRVKAQGAWIPGFKGSSAGHSNPLPLYPSTPFILTSVPAHTFPARPGTGCRSGCRKRS